MSRSISSMAPIASSPAWTRASRIAMKRLEQQRVRVLLNTLVSEIRPGAVHTKDGAQLRGRTIVWSGGVKVNPLVASLDVPKSKDGRIEGGDEWIHFHAARK